jgi:hypothetical protein
MMWYTGSKRNLDRGYKKYTWTGWHLIRELFGTNALKERADVAVGE